MHCKRIQIIQAHRPGGITPRRGFLLLFCVGAVVWVCAVGRCTAFLCCGHVGVPLRRSGRSVGCLWGLWAQHCAAVLPSYLKRIFDRFFQGIRDRTPPERGLAVRLQALHQHTTESAPPAAHRRHSVHQQNQPQQAPTDSTSKTSHSKPRQIAPARTTPPGTVQSHQHRENTSDFITHFQANFSDFPGLVLFPPA